MSELPKRKPNRLSGYDYSKDGWYFVTICARDKKNIFGEIEKCRGGVYLRPLTGKDIQEEGDFVPKVKLSPIGQIIEKQWQEIPSQYKNVAIDNFIIMPNHLHGIIIIDHYGGEQICRAGVNPAPTLSDIVRLFKSKCSIEYLEFIKRNKLTLCGKIWQRSFYDHVIRNEKSLYEIRYYIQNNPWEKEWW